MSGATVLIAARRVRSGGLLVTVLAHTSLAQARVVSAPAEPSLVSITRDWERASSLGDLRELRTAADHLELRVWGGYGMGATQAVVVRRAAGHWIVLLARVKRCAIEIPNAVGDTAGAATMHRYVVEARRRCDIPLTDVRAGMRIITADTLAVDTLAVAESTIEGAWQRADRAGVTRLPAEVSRGDVPSSDFTYVVELRRGNEYRASQIQHVEPAVTEADRAVQEIYAAVSALLPAGLVVKP